MLMCQPMRWAPGVTLMRGCAAYWPMWDRSGKRVADVSGNGRDGTHFGFAATNAQWTSTRRGPALLSDTENSIFQTSYTCDAFSMASNNFSISAWALFRSWPFGAATQVITSQASGLPGTYNAYGVGVLANGDIQYYINDGATLVTGSYAAGVAAGEWHHLGVTFTRGENSRLYLDGLCVDETDIAAVGTLDTCDDAYMGAQLFDTADLALGGVGIWSRLLTGGEMRALYKDQFCSSRPHNAALMETASST